jgi:hypothetical protein
MHTGWMSLQKMAVCQVSMTDTKNMTWIPPSWQNCKKTAILEQIVSPLAVWCPENHSFHLSRKGEETSCKCDCPEPLTPQVTPQMASGQLNLQNTVGKAHMARHSGITFIESLMLGQQVCGVIMKTSSRKSCAYASASIGAIIMWVM